MEKNPQTERAGDAPGGNETEPNRLNDALGRARARAEGMLEDLRAQGPAAIDITDRLDSMPVMVLDEVIRLRDQLSEGARITLYEWQRAPAAPGNCAHRNRFRTWRVLRSRATLSSTRKTPT